jgi:hypothetical protein
MSAPFTAEAGSAENVKVSGRPSFFSWARISAEGGAAEHERIGHVAGGVAEEGDLLALQRGGILLRTTGGVALGEREHVRHELARMQEVGERVHDGHRAAAGELLEQAVLVATDHHAMEVTGKDAGGVRDGLAARDLEVVGVEHHRQAAELMDADLEGNAGAGALLEEHQAPGLVREGGAGGLAAAGLERRGGGEDLGRLGRAQVGLLQEMTHLGKRLNIPLPARLDSGK